ncbi:hypothetical protein KC19_10G122000 [Ceratodon purpureus]|uniref:Protein kinase domain-containing protein n=1 Tax=Ceratodon purpureus TaxID=3225 RepID=A0A8T0GPN0_CERPU|nr:hypothetical protein KC19_10G122000 [Ceratodon purpureus]
MALRKGYSKGMSLRNTHSGTSSSAESDFLNLCQQNVCIIQALVNGGSYLMNGRQCRDLFVKLFKTVRSTQELVFCCRGSTDLFRPALESLYRILEKARLLVNKCSKDDWITEAVFQIENAKDFQVILLEVGLCYHAIYEQAKDNMVGKWSFQHLGQVSSTFRPASVDDIHNDQDDLKRRLEGLVSSYQNSPAISVQYLRLCLARYLLVTWECIFQQSRTNEFNLSRAILCMKEMESSETWGKGDYLGHGSCGGVCSSTWLGVPCAKKIFDGEVNENFFLKEAGILLHLNHPHVVKFFCCDNGQEGGVCFIAMELMEMSLAKLISNHRKREVPFSYPVALEIIVQIARAMCYLHGMGVAHRDLKPQNVVVNKLTSPHLENQYCVKLVDFGMSKVKVEVSKSNIMTGPGIGTTKYRAPEVHPNAHPDGHGKVNWFKADVYSFGVTCAHLLSLNEPFENMKMGEIYMEQMNGLKPEVPATCPEKLVVLLNDCWNTSPTSRPGFTEICVKLEEVRHELLRGLSPPNQGFKKFIRIEIEDHSATRRQHIASTDDFIELQPTFDTFVTSNMDNMDGRAIHLEYSHCAMDVFNHQRHEFIESSSSIDKVTLKDEPASTLESSVCQTADNKAMMLSRSNFSKGGEPEFLKPHDGEGVREERDDVARVQPWERLQTLQQRKPPMIISSLPKIWYKKIKSLTVKDKKKKKTQDANGVAYPLELAQYPSSRYGDQDNYFVEGEMDLTTRTARGEWNPDFPTKSARGDSPELRKLMQETPQGRAAGSQSDRSNWASKEKIRIRDQSISLRLESFPEELRSLLWSAVD